jgi:hypothetical protein
MAESSGGHIPRPRYRPDVSGRQYLPPLCSNVSILAAGVGQGNCKKQEVGGKTPEWWFYEQSWVRPVGMWAFECRAGMGVVWPAAKAPG